MKSMIEVSAMGNRELRPLKRDLSAEDQAEVVRARTAVAAEVPQVKARVRLLDEAATEQTFSGMLRRSIHTSGIDLHLLAKRAGVDMLQLDEFLTGERTLRSDAIDRLMMVLGIETVGITHVPATNGVLPLSGGVAPGAVPQ